MRRAFACSKECPEGPKHRLTVSQSWPEPDRFVRASAAIPQGCGPCALTCRAASHSCLFALPQGGAPWLATSVLGSWIANQPPAQVRPTVAVAHRKEIAPVLQDPQGCGPRV